MKEGVERNEPLGERIFLHEPSWNSTFPHRATPRADEWLAGLLLRCDEVNSWTSGTTNAYLLRNSTYNASQVLYHTLIPPAFLLEELAELLAVSLPRLSTTTYLLELKQIYHLSRLPHPMLLAASSVFHFCPECARNRLLRRVLMLAYVMCCPLHELALCQRCPCGTPQRLFCRQAKPFTCRSCGLDWASFPHIAVSAEAMSCSQELLRWYEVFFTRGTPALFSSALKLIRRKLSQQGASGIRLLDGKMRFASPSAPGRVSLGHMVDWLVSLHLSPSEVAMGDDISYFLPPHE